VDPNLQSAVRRAVASGEFTRARRLWEQYALQGHEEMRRGPDPQATLEEARQLMVWCRQMTLAARAQAQAQLDNLARRTRVAAAYGQETIRPPGSLRAARY
jgi:hypothetical protein